MTSISVVESVDELLDEQVDEQEDEQAIIPEGYEFLGEIVWQDAQKRGLPIAESTKLHPSMLLDTGYVKLLSHKNSKVAANVIFNVEYVRYKFNRLVDQLALQGNELTTFFNEYIDYAKDYAERIKAEKTSAIFAELKALGYTDEQISRLNQVSA